MALRVDVLANDRASFVKPMAEGLVRMLRDCGAEPRLHYDGLAHLMRRTRPDLTSPRALAGSLARLPGNVAKFGRFIDEIADTGLIIVVTSVPGSFSPTVFPNVERLRAELPHVPILNYDLHYLPTLDSWSRYLLKGERTGLSEEAVSVFRNGRFGLERYDWYLMASVGTYVPMPAGPQPYSLIGIDLDDGTLYPDQQGKVRVLVDFDAGRSPFSEIRKVQLEAIRRSGLAYEVLEGRYTTDEIKAIYRRTSIFLMSRSEAFGLPVAELQACGSLIFTPDPYWPCAHWLGSDYTEKREPRLSPNFVVYENDADSLAASLREAAAEASPERVRATLLEYQPEMFRGDREELARCLEDVRNGKIHSRLHSSHYPIGRPRQDTAALQAAQ